jgi:hypothetical protein
VSAMVVSAKFVCAGGSDSSDRLEREREREREVRG